MSDVKGVSVLSVVSEIFPLIKTGGLGDVTGALPLALREHGVRMVTLVPGYPAVVAALENVHAVLADDDLFGGPARLLAGYAAGHDLLVIDAPHLFDRDGNPYVDADGIDWPDNALRFAALGWVAARIGLGEVAQFRPDIVHCHDWQAGLTLGYLAYDGRPVPGSVVTIHNLAYQGLFPAEMLSALRLPPAAFQVDGIEYYGKIGYLKAGLQFADRITTVSPTYAAEMQTPANGFGLDGLLRGRSDVITGITNGIDVNVWNPLRDTRIPMRFGRTTLSKRTANKAHLQRRFALEENPERLLLGVVSRLAWQKGLDILADALPILLDTGAQLVVLGTGEQALERRLVSLVESHPGRVGCIVGYNEDLAHLMQAGADAMLVPSRYEPCGLTQLCALQYGAVPVVAKVGGLADTIYDPEETSADAQRATGVQFSPVTQDALEAALIRTSQIWSRKKQWKNMQLNGMRTDVSWKKSAALYARLYVDLLAAKN
ncbi:MAG TPA: glycogen synthase GlgA [Micropepsaceae bacterium]|jgi:starch synthase